MRAPFCFPFYKFDRSGSRLFLFFIKTAVVGCLQCIALVAITSNESAAQFQLNGYALHVNEGCIQLTQDAENQVASAIYLKKISLDRPFDIRFAAYFGEKDLEGADGIAFVLHNDDREVSAIGPKGGGIGFGENEFPIGSLIQPSIAIEFDTYENVKDSVFNDIMSDHIALVRDGKMNPTIGPVTPLDNLEDDQCHHIRIVWNPSYMILQAYLDSSLVLSQQINLIDSIFSGESSVWWGFTASTGHNSNRQMIRYRPDPEEQVNCKDCFAPIIKSDRSWLCGPGAIRFYNDITEDSASWDWRFPGGEPSSSDKRYPGEIMYSEPGTYEATLIVQIGSRLDTSKKTIVVYELPKIDAGRDTTICQGESVQLQEHIPDRIIARWEEAAGLADPNIRHPIVTPLETTAYILVGETRDGCKNRDTVIVTVQQPPLIELEGRAICNRDSVRLQPQYKGAGNYSFRWSPSTGLDDNTLERPMARPTVTTTYTLTVTDNTVCAFSTSITVTVEVVTTFTVAISQDSEICPGDSIALFASAGGIFEEYWWEPSDGLDDRRSATPQARPNRTTEYTVTVSNDICSSSASVTIVVTPPPAVDVGPDQTRCSLDPIELHASVVSENFEHVIYSWSPAEGLSDVSSATTSAMPNRSILYTVTVTDTLTGCSGTDQVWVRLGRFVSIDVDDTEPICAGDSLQLSVRGTADRFAWSPATGLSDPSIRNPVASPSTTITYTVSAYAGECTAQQEVTVVVYPEPKVDAPDTVTYCRFAGRGVLLDVHGSDEFTYHWEPAAGLDNPSSRTPLASPDSATIYTLTVNSGPLCSAQYKIFVEVAEGVIVDAGDNRSMCSDSEGVRLSANVRGATTFRWSPAAGLDDPLSLTPRATPQRTTLYTLTASNAVCSAVDSVLVIVHPAPHVTTYGDTIICSGTEVRLSVEGDPVSVVWSPATTLSDPTVRDPIAYPERTITYIASIINEFGCRAVDSVRIEVNPSYNMHFSLASGAGEYQPGDTAHVLLMIDALEMHGDTRIEGFRCALRYDPQRLRYSGANAIEGGSAAPGWRIAAIEDPNSQLLHLEGRTGISEETFTEGVIVRLAFDVLLSGNQTQPITLELIENAFEIELDDTKGRSICADLAVVGTELQPGHVCLRDGRGIHVGPASYELYQNAPNPALEETIIEFSIGFDGPTKLALYSALGDELQVLIDDVLAAGRYSISLPVETLSSGLYTYRLQSGPFNAIGIMAVTR